MTTQPAMAVLAPWTQVIAVASCVAVTGCDSATASMVCAPGLTQACACPAGGTGAQTCMANGGAWGQCIGCSASVDSGRPADADSSTVKPDAAAPQNRDLGKPDKNCAPDPTDPFKPVCKPDSRADVPLKPDAKPDLKLPPQPDSSAKPDVLKPDVLKSPDSQQPDLRSCEAPPYQPPCACARGMTWVGPWPGGGCACASSNPPSDGLPHYCYAGTWCMTAPGGMGSNCVCQDPYIGCWCGLRDNNGKPIPGYGVTCSAGQACMWTYAPGGADLGIPKWKCQVP